MQDCLTQFTDYLLHQSWQIAVLAAGIAAISRLLRDRTAHLRYLLWLIVLAKCLVPPLLAVPLPVLPSRQPLPGAAAVMRRVPGPTLEVGSMTALEFSELHFPASVWTSEPPILTPPEVFEPGCEPVQSQASPNAPPRPNPRPRLTVRQQLGAAWAIGVAVFVLAVGAKAVRTLLWLRCRRRLLPEDLRVDLERALEGTGFGSLPRLWLMRGAGQPFVWGLLRGNVYLPEDFIRIGHAAHRRDILGHELSHVLRLDAAVNLLQIMAQAVFWFHPVVWWMNKRIRMEREKCCDEMAISRLGVEAKSYSVAILQTLIADCRSARPVPSLAIAGPVRNVEERIRAIMKPGKKFHKHPSTAGKFLVLWLALLTVPTTLILTARADRPNVPAKRVASGHVDALKRANPQEDNAPGAARSRIPEANLQIPDDLKPCAERLRSLYGALKRFEKDKGSLPDWLSDLVPEYLDAEMLIWPENGPQSTPLAREPHLPCSFGYQYSSQLSLSGGTMSYRQFKNKERKVWGDVVPLVRYYRGSRCLNVSFDGRVYMSGTAWEKEIPSAPGVPEPLILQEVSIAALSEMAKVRPGTRPWGPEQAIGAPDTLRAGDLPTAWASLYPDAGQEWLKVDFDRAVSICGIRVRQTFNPGAIAKVTAVLENGMEHVLWEGRDPMPSAPGDADFILWVDEQRPDDTPDSWIRKASGITVISGVGLDQDIVSKSIKIYLDTTRRRGWNEIDAVQLLGKDGKKQWASKVTASSTYATRASKPRGVAVDDPSHGAAPRATMTKPATARAEVVALDDFDGKPDLEWKIIHPNPSNYSLTRKPGALTITTKKGHFSKRNQDYENVFLLDVPVGAQQDFQMTTCLSSFQPKAHWNQAGILCWDDEDNYLKLVYEWAGQPAFTVGHEVAGRDRYTYSPAPSMTDRVWLRITKRGASYHCLASTDGKSFAPCGVASWKKDGPQRVGLFANNGSFWYGAVPDLDASFEFFEIAVAPPVRAEAPGEAGTASYEADLEAFFQEMDNTYPFFDLKGIHDIWASTKERLREEVKSCTSDGTFLEIATEAVLCLRDSHMWFRDARVPPPQRPPRYCPGICLWPAADDRVVIAHGREELDPGLTAGTVVTKIDGQDARQYLEEQAAARWAEGGISSPQRARVFAYRIALAGETEGEKHAITILADGREREIELTSNVEARGWAHFYNLPKGMTQVGRSCWHTMLPSGTAYVYLRRVDDSTGSGLKEAFSKYTDAAGWIIDLRGNGGGGYAPTLHEALQQLPGPLAVLIDAGCTSAGETLARDFVHHGNARLFGSKTAGSSSSKRMWTFPSGIASLSVPTRGRWGIDGNPIEFLGIDPHVKVEAVPDEVQRGLNSGILRAEEYLHAIQSAEPRENVL